MHADDQRAPIDAAPFVVYECEATPPYADRFVSPQVQRHYGWSPQQFYADSNFWREVIHPDDRDAVEAAVEAVIRDGAGTFEYRVRDAEGRFLWCRDFAQLVPASGEQPAYIRGSWVDIDNEVNQRQRALWRGELLAAIGRAQAAFIAEQPTAAVCSGVLNDLLALSRSSFGLIAECQPDCPELQLHAMCGDATEALEVMPSATLRDWLQGLANEGESVVFEQAAGEIDFSELPGAPQVHRLACLPIRHREQVLGLVLLGDRDSAYQTEQFAPLQPLLTTLGQLLAAAGDARARRREQAERDRLAMLLAKLTVAVIIADREGRICWLNPGFSKVTGYSAEEALGQRPDQLLAGPDTNHEAMQQLAADVERGELCELEVCNYRKNGRPYWARLRIEPIFDAGGERNGYIAMQSDISAEHAERNRRRELATRLENLSQTIPGMLFQYQRDRAGNAHFPWSSEGIRDIFGLSPEQARLGSAPAFEAVHPDDQARVRASIETSARQQARWHCEFRVINADGRQRDLYGVAMPQVLDADTTLWHGYITDIGRLKQAQRAERIARDQLAKLIDSATDVSIIATDLEGTVTVFNSGAERLLGYAAETVIGKVSPALFHDPKEVGERSNELSRELGRPIEGFDTFVWAAREGRSERRPWTYIRKDGERRHVVLSVTAVHDDSGQLSGFLGIATDRTRELLAEHALRSSEAKFRNLYESANVAIILSRFSDGKILQANAALQTIIGHLREDFTGLNEDKLVPLDQTKLLAQQRNVLFRCGRCGPFASQYLRRDGSRVDVLISRILERQEDGTEVVWSLIQDITAHKRTEALALESARALVHNVERTRIILDSTADGIISVDAGGRIESINRAAQAMFGLSESELLDHGVGNILCLDLREGETHEVSLLRLAESSGRLPSEIRGRRGDGSELELEMTLTRVERDEGALFVGVLRDISQRKRIEQMKNQFISTVSHELRTPLTSIRGAIGLVASGSLGALSSHAERLMSVAGKNIERLSHLINDLLDMEKLLAGELRLSLRPVRLDELLAQAMELNRGLEVGFEVQLSLQIESPAWADVDPDRLQQVLGNLISNASKFSPKGGRVRLQLLLREQRVRLVISDQGKGVPAEFLPRLFQKFSQADASDTRRFGGTGLGLAISRELVTRMGGEIGCDSPSGQGASFWVEFPRLPEQQPLAGPTLRLVEADAQITASVSAIAGRVGLHVQHCADLDAAIEAPGKNEFVLLTIRPQEGTRELQSRLRPLVLRHRLQQTPLLLLSVIDDEADRLTDPCWELQPWAPEPIALSCAMSWTRALLDQRSDRQARVLVVEANPALSRELAADAYPRALSECVSNVDEARHRLQNSRFDLVLIDLGHGLEDGWSLLGSIRQQQPVPATLLLTLAEPSVARHATPKQAVAPGQPPVPGGIETGAEWRQNAEHSVEDRRD